MRTHMSSLAVMFIAVTAMATAVWAGQPVEGVRSEKGFPDGGSHNEAHIIPGAAFSHDGFYATDPYVFWFFLGAVQGPSSNTWGCLMAPASVPGDANIYQFWASMYDNEPAWTMAMALSRLDNFSGIRDVMAEVTTSADSTAIQSLGDTTVIYPEVIFPNYSYYVTGCVYNGNHKLYSTRVWYEPKTIFRDGVETSNTSRWDAAQP